MPKTINRVSSVDEGIPPELNIQFFRSEDPDDASTFGLEMLSIDDHAASKLKRSIILAKRDEDPIYHIQDDTQDTDDDGSDSDSTQDYVEEYKQYLAVFDGLQAKVINIILPILKEMLKHSTYEGVYDAALSIHSDITFSSVVVQGPFKYGTNNFDVIGAGMKESLDKVDTPQEERDQAWNQILAVHFVLIAK